MNPNLNVLDYVQQFKILKYLELKNYCFNPGVNNNPLIPILPLYQNENVNNNINNINNNDNPNMINNANINNDIQNNINVYNNLADYYDILPSNLYSFPEREVCSKFLAKVCKDKKGINCLTVFNYSRQVLFGSSNGNLSICNINDISGNNSITIVNKTTDPSSAYRAMTFNKDESYLLIGDKKGKVSYFKAHQFKEAEKTLYIHNGIITDICFSINDSKFITSGEDKKVTVIDFVTGNADYIFMDKHLSDVKTCDWSHKLGLIASGGKDKLLMLWDPRSKEIAATLHSHIDTINKARFSLHSNLLISAGKDSVVKVTDLRNLKELQAMKGHNGEVNSLCWHPVFSDICCSAGADSKIIHWKIGEEKSKVIEQAHDKGIFDLCYNKTGTLLVSGANDGNLKFWTKENFWDINQTNVI